jgi:hypothetical protein
MRADALGSRLLGRKLRLVWRSLRFTLQHSHRHSGDAEHGEARLQQRFVLPASRRIPTPHLTLPRAANAQVDFRHQSEALTESELGLLIA